MNSALTASLVVQEAKPVMLPPTTNNNAKTLPMASVKVSLPIVIVEWQKNGRETLGVRLDEFHGQHVIDCRVWYADAAGNKKLGRGGLTASPRHLPELVKALDDALNAAITQGLLNGHQL